MHTKLVVLSCNTDSKKELRNKGDLGNKELVSIRKLLKLAMFSRPLTKVMEEENNFRERRCSVKLSCL